MAPAKRKPKLPKLPPLPVMEVPPPPDLSRFTEKTRDAVHSHVFKVRFSHPYMLTAGWRVGEEYPLHASERTELAVFHAFGRWFAAWRDSEVDKHLPLEHRWRVIRITAAPTAPGGLMLTEV